MKALITIFIVLTFIVIPGCASRASQSYEKALAYEKALLDKEPSLKRIDMQSISGEPLSKFITDRTARLFLNVTVVDNHEDGSYQVSNKHGGLATAVSAPQTAERRRFSHTTDRCRFEPLHSVLDS